MLLSHPVNGHLWKLRALKSAKSINSKGRQGKQTARETKTNYLCLFTWVSQAFPLLIGISSWLETSAFSSFVNIPRVPLPTYGFAQSWETNVHLSLKPALSRRHFWYQWQWGDHLRHPTTMQEWEVAGSLLGVLWGSPHLSLRPRKTELVTVPAHGSWAPKDCIRKVKVNMMQSKGTDGSIPHSGCLTAPGPPPGWWGGSGFERTANANSLAAYLWPKLGRLWTGCWSLESGVFCEQWEHHS